ncbi:hypothetical protein SDC9_208424 [bioreactor metagenome]|uniref:HTH marR-type domain-containing protein n=1 Tax=bioreactor metagenome TaxID=1076179 RepID=A0A645JM58_9ZZZZ
MIDDLEKKGIVFRENDPEDRRKVLISLTDKGLEYCDYFDKVINEILAVMDQYDVEDYLRSLETMVTILKKTTHRGI